MRYAALLALLFACGGDDGGTGTLYDRLGGADGVRAIVADWIDRAYADDAINGYFRNASVDKDHLVTCMASQLAVETGGDALDASCQSPEAADQGRGISRADFDDLIGHLGEALAHQQVADADRQAVLDLMNAHDGVVEDPTNDHTVYQRVGRKPGILTAASAFEARIGADPMVNGFFAGVTDYTRIHACLSRQLCSIDGPCKYGEEEAEEFPGLTNQTACRPMAAAHFGLQDQQGNPITIDDFNEIVADLAMTLTEAGVSSGDIDAIAGALAPLCSEIVAGGTGCP